jgi:hypothetical protein
MLGSLRWAPVYGKGVLGLVYGAPVFEVGFETGFDFPVFDEVFDKRGKAVWGVVFGFG